MSISQVDLEEITRHRIWPCLTDYRRKFKSSSLSTGNTEYKSTHNRCDKSKLEPSDRAPGSTWCLVTAMSCLMEEGLRITGVSEVIHGVPH